jgi:hypothetical protein
LQPVIGANAPAPRITVKMPRRKIDLDEFILSSFLNIQSSCSFKKAPDEAFGAAWSIFAESCCK